MSAELPTEQVELDEKAGRVTLSVDATLYPLAALYGAAYVFIDRCYVLLDKLPGNRFQVVLAGKSGPAERSTLEVYAGEFLNELLSCAWREQITSQNRAAIEAVTTQAIAGAMGAPSIDDLATFDFSNESFEDPLGIAMSWEDKYKKKDATVDASAEAAAAGDSKPEGPT